LLAAEHDDLLEHITKVYDDRHRLTLPKIVLHMAERYGKRLEFGFSHAASRSASQVLPSDTDGGKASPNEP
jgi:hypothetical protein